MSPDEFRRLVAAGLSNEQIAIVMEMFDEREEVRKASQRARWRKHQENKKNANVSQREQTLANVPRGGVTRVEDKTSNSEIEPQKKEGDAQMRDALEAYSAMAERTGLAVPRVVTAARRARLQAVIREHGLPTFLEAVSKVGSSSFCRGENERGWKADLDFILQAKSFTKILEGHYDDRQPAVRAGPKPETPADVAARLLSEMRSANGQPGTSDSRHSQALVAIPGGKLTGFG